MIFITIDSRIEHLVNIYNFNNFFAEPLAKINRQGAFATPARMKGNAPYPITVQLWNKRTVTKFMQSSFASSTPLLVED